METEHKNRQHRIPEKLLPSLKDFSDSFLKRIISGEYDSAAEFLKEFLEAHLSENRYPKGIGSGLFDALVAISQEKKAKIQFPLFPTTFNDRLFAVADSSNSTDAKLLFIINSGNSIKTLQADNGNQDHAIENRLEIILRKIDAINLTRKIALPIDSARASFAFQSVTADPDGFDEVLVSFYSHLLSSLNRKISDSDHYALGAEAYELLNRAYTNKGGIKAAMVDVVEGVNGGLRQVFDAMVEQLKYEEKEAYVNYVLKTEIDPLDWDAKVSLMKSFLEKLRGNLPKEITRDPPERFVSNWEVIVKAYVRSIEQVKSILKLF